MDRFFYNLERFLKKHISRRKFFKICFGGLAYFVSQSMLLKTAFAKSVPSSGRIKRNIKGDYDLVLAEGKDPYQNTLLAVEKLGGMERFVKKGATVLIKPNMAWNRTPPQAANTEPQVIAALVDLSYKAGAKRVNIFENPCNDEKMSYENSGIAHLAREKGAHVYFCDHWNVVKAHFPYDSPMEGWPIFKDAVECDTFINVPVLKHHSLTKLTLSMKNLMGVCSGNRGMIHVNIGRKLVDLTSFINPDLTVIDATRVLFRHGPSGGSLEDVKALDKVIAACDPTLADSFACYLANVDPMSVPYIKNAASRGIGNADIRKANILKVNT